MTDNPDEGKASQVGIGERIVQAIDHSTASLTEITYENVWPRPVEQAVIDTAWQKLAEMPLDSLPVTGSLPTSSRLPALVRNPSFVDREAELRRIAVLLKGSELATAAVAGLGGKGKSQLAIEFVYRYGHYFRGSVFWLSFANEDAITAEVAACHTALGQELRLDATTLPPAGQVQLVLSAWQNALPRLLVFDNCEEERLLAKWRPSSGGCRILITSHRADWHPDLRVQVLHLDVLPRAESKALLGKYCAELLDADREAIADELGDLPLALYLTGKYLQEYQESPLGEPAAYLASLRRITPLHHPSLAAEELTYTTGHVQNVERTFSASYERLNPSNSIDVAALKLLARAAYFAPGEPIPRDLLRATMGEPDNDLLEGTVVKALQRLGTLGLLDKQQRNFYRMHRLLTVFVKERGASTDTKAQSDVEHVMLERAQQLNSAGDPAPLLALQRHLREVTNTALESKSELAAELCNELGMHLRSIAAYSQAETYLQRALAIREHMLGPKHHQVATSLYNLAWLYQDQGKYEQAKPLYERALRIREQTLGAEHPGLVSILENYASLLRKMKRKAEAAKLEERAKAIRVKFPS
jgi:tetratricopeptide (TPR) repeat protein